MIRRFLFFSAFALLLADSTMAQVTITTDLPASVAPGASFTVELNVAKSDVTGFAKLQQQLPSGFTATAGETANATFSFKDRKVKFLWMALPNSDFKVSYNVELDESLSGNQIIEGTFAYIQDNDTKKFIIPKDIISIQAAQGDPEKEAMDKILADQKAKEEAATAAREAAAAEEASAVEEVTEEVVEAIEEATEVAVEETPEVAVEETTEVAVEETTEVEGNSAAEEAEAEAARVATAAEEAAERKRETEEARKAELERKLEEARRAQEIRREEEAAKTETAQDTETAQHTETPTDNYNDSMMKSKPGLVFRVQVAAGSNQVAPSFFEEKYGISESVVVEEHDDLFKYVVGEFGSYRPAKTFRIDLSYSNGVNGPFVTAYNDGVRIHVKEALEIAGQ